MSLILDGLKRAQQIRLEMQQRAQGFGTSLPWLSHWRRRWIIPRRLILALGLAIAIALFLTMYKRGAHGPPAPTPQTTDSMVTVPIREGPFKELKEELAEIPLEEVRLRPVPIPASSKTKPISAPSRDEEPREVARDIPKSAPQPAKSERPILKKPTEKQMSIQPIPTHKAINHFNLGLVYHKNNKLQRALQEYRKALELDPLNVQAHNNLGMIYKALGRLPDAIMHYQKAISINPNYEKAHHNLAVAHYLQDDYEKAILQFKLALDCNPKNPETYNNMGLIYRKQKDLHRAKRVFEIGLSIAPNYGPIHYNLALTLEEEGSLKAAILHYRKFVELSPDNHRELVQKVKRHLEVLTSYETG